MKDTDKSRDMNKALFANLVMMLSSSAMQQLGKLVNPVTHKTETHLEAAQITIDMLAMLKDKTRGNLDAEEERMITDLLASLQMNYVETAQSAPKEPVKEPAAAKTENPDGPAEPAAGTRPEADSKKDPKYHKSYGG